MPVLPFSTVKPTVAPSEFRSRPPDLVWLVTPELMGERRLVTSEGSTQAEAGRMDRLKKKREERIIFVFCFGIF